MGISRTGLGTEEDFVLFEDLNKKLSENPDNVQLLLKKGFLGLDAFEDDALAIPPLKRAFNIEPNNVEIMFWFAYADYILVGDRDNEKQLLEKALAINPKRADCHYLYATIFDCNDDEGNKKIVYHYKMALKLKPDWLTVRISLIMALMRECRFGVAKKITLEGLRIFEKFELPPTATSMEDYYECYITGRTYYDDEDLRRLLKEINSSLIRFWFPIFIIVAIGILYFLLKFKSRCF